MPITFIASGFVNSDGTSYGEGFTARRLDTGRYQIRLHRSEGAVPVLHITATRHDWAADAVREETPRFFLVESVPPAHAEGTTVTCVDA